MTPTTIPARITIDFREAVYPSRSWILGLDGDAEGRVELLAFEDRPSSLHARPAVLTADCTCPDFCERDHANE